MDAELELIALAQRVIDAGTSEPGTWAKSQRPLVLYCRELLNRIGRRRVGGRQAQVLESLEDAFTRKR